MPVLCSLAIYASSSCVRSRLGVGPSRSPSQGDVLTERVTPFPRGPQGAVELGWSVFARRLLRFRDGVGRSLYEARRRPRTPLQPASLAPWVGSTDLNSVCRANTTLPLRP